MRTIKLFITALALGFLTACGGGETQNGTTDSPQENTPNGGDVGQSNVKDETSAPNIVQTASSSPDHTTLVTALKAAELVDELSNAGPFTVFAPTNAAFDKLPEGTLDDLLKPENKEKLADILSYHTYVGGLKVEYMNDGQEFEMVNASKIKISKSGGVVKLNGIATVGATLSTSNGYIHVIDEVLLPPDKK